MTSNRLIQATVASLLILIGAATVTISNAQSSNSTQSGCTQWSFHPVPNVNSTAEGYLLCPSTGELWQIKGAKKHLVQKK